MMKYIISSRNYQIAHKEKDIDEQSEDVELKKNSRMIIRKITNI